MSITIIPVINVGYLLLWLLVISLVVAISGCCLHALSARPMFHVEYATYAQLPMELKI